MLHRTGSRILLPLFADNSKLETEEDEIWGALLGEFRLEFVVVFRLEFVEVGLEFGGVYSEECGGLEFGVECGVLFKEWVWAEWKVQIM